jgi:uncharacterized membrane protein
MRPRTAYLFFCLLGCLIILAGLAYTLYLQHPLNSPALAIMAALGGYLVLANGWAYWLSDNSLGIAVGATTHATVVGFVIILATLSLRLMQYPLDPELLQLIPALGVLLLILGLLLSSHSWTVATNAEWRRTQAATSQRRPEPTQQTQSKPSKNPRADRYGMPPISAYTLISVLGFLLILYAIAHRLQFAHYSTTLITVLIALGGFIMLLASWLYRQTGIVRVIRPYRYLGLGTVVCVLGLLLIFTMLSLQLMHLAIATAQYRAAFGGGVVLILLGLILTRSSFRCARLSLC